eukprot:TRINITY_DN19028_c0_g1_i1.p1 TRINITY_DN19028_c0_g1~~TRINITY_DN19028_c0_g1_i1.p1  ORF type:complete len:482 (-),score=124.78 TRINITY_DN19028_c0_g1_i1:83-1528(-)
MWPHSIARRSMDYCASVELSTTPETYPVWSGDVCLSGAEAAGDLEFKFAILQSHGAVVWESGDNRRFSPQPEDPKDTMNLDKGQVVARFGETAASAADAGRGEELPRLDSSTSTCLLDRGDTLTSAESSNFLLRVSDSFNDVQRSSDFDAPPENEAVSPVVSAAETPTPAVALEPEAPANPETAEAPALGEAVAADVPTEAPATTGRLWLRSGAHQEQKCGGAACEDAYCVGSHTLAVADGVSQMAEYAKHGVDAAKYAAELMELTAAALQTDGTETPAEAAVESESPPSKRAADAMAAAAAGATTFGASTITVLTLSGATAGVANLGDSGFMLLRAKPWGMEIIERSIEQQHGWNCPYQLTRLPAPLAARYRSIKFDSAADCQRYDVSVQAGDLLMLFTDGLTDNLHWFEILKITDEAIGDLGSAAPPERIAEALVLAAKERSVDEVTETPFSKEARRQRQHCPGGKVDDITVTAAWVMA